MGTISKVTQGSLAKNSKLNEVIGAINSITSMSVRAGAGGESPQFIFAENRSELITASGGSATDGGGGGGGIPDGFAEETLDIVDSNNLAAQRIFLTKDVV